MRFVFVTLLATLAAGCGATPRQSTVPRPTELSGTDDLEALAPPASRGFFFIDLAGIRSTRLYGVMDEDLALFGELAEDAAAQLDDFSPFGIPTPTLADALNEPGRPELPEPDAEPLDILSRPDWIFVASNPRRNPPTAITFFGARFSDEEARSTVQLAAGGADMPALPFGMGAPATEDPLGLGVADEGAARVRVREVRGLRAFVAREYQLVELAEGLWVLGTEADVRGVLDRRGRPARPDAPRLHDRLGLFDHHLVIAIEDARSLRELLADETPSPFAGEDEAAEEEDDGPAWLEHIDAAGMHLDLDGGVRAEWLLELSEGADAEAVRGELRAALDEVARAPFTRLYHLSAPIAAMTPTLEGERIRMAFSLDDRESELLWARLSGAAALVIGAIQLAGEFARGFGEGFGRGADALDFGMPTGSLDASVPGEPLLASPGMSPVTLQDTAGGDVDASQEHPGCVGWIGMVHHPLTVTEPTYLRIVARGASDSTLAVQLEDGTWLCNDDTEGTDPMVEGELPAGAHRIFVGAFTRFDMHAYTLGVSTDPAAMPSSLPAPASSAAALGGAELRIEPRGADPQSLRGVASGEVNIDGLAGACTGFSTDMPGHGVEVTEELPRLRVFVRADQPVGLVMRRPDGELVCGVDANGTYYDGPALPGLWDVWVTVATEGAQVPYVLGFSREDAPGPADLPAP